MAININRYRLLYFKNGGSKEMDVNGSVTPVEFTLEDIPALTTYRITRIFLYIEDGTDFASDEFGGLAALTNGLQMISGSGPGDEIFNLQDNIDIVGFFSEITQVQILKTGASGPEQHVVATNGLQNDVAVDDDLKIVVRDNLTGLDFLRVGCVVQYD